MPSRKHVYTMLIVDDDVGDIELLSEALEEASLPCATLPMTDGDSALALLRNPEEPAVDLMLLDLNLAGQSGLDVLREVRQDPRLCRLPVVVYTGSWAEQDISACYEAGANAVIIKPMGFGALMTTLEGLFQFWFRVAALPRSVL